MHCDNFGEIGLMVLKKKFNKSSQCAVVILQLSPLREGHGPLFGTNLNSFHQRMLGVKFGGNWPSGSGDEDNNVKSFQRHKQSRWANCSLEPLAQFS